MTRKVSVLIALVALMGGTALAQDARSILQAYGNMIGANNVKSVQYSGTGAHGFFGQAFTPNDDWPRTDIKSYTRTIDYDSKSSKEDMVRVQGNNPARGGGFVPLIGEVKSTTLVSDKYAWNLNNQGNAVPQPAAAEVRQFDIWVTPYGFVKAALASNPTVTRRNVRGKMLNVVGFTTMGKYRVTGEFNDQNVLERVLTWIPDPVLGDMQYEIRYLDYKDYGGMKYPSHIHAHQGDNPVHPGRTGFNVFDLRLTDLKTNVSGAALTVPDNVRTAPMPQARATSDKLADGVWLIGGAGANSLAVDFRDFITVIETPANEERSNAVIAEVKRLIPNKPIRYAVNTHNHFDHLGGVRTYVAEGATIVTNEINREFYEKIVFAPQIRTLSPDRLSLFPFATTGPNTVNQLETFTDKYSITDGNRQLEIHHVQGLNHNGGMAMIYFPKERIIVNADLYSPPTPEAPLPARANQSAFTFYDNVKRLKLDPATVAPIHGRPGPWDEFVKWIEPQAAARQRGGAVE